MTLRDWLACAAAVALPAPALAHSTCPMDRPTGAQLGPAGGLATSLRSEPGGRILVIEGGIDDDAAAKIEKALAGAGQIDEIWLRSGGGDAAAGNAAGRVLRKSGIPVRVPSGWWCVSACNFLFFGGAIRQIDPGGVFAVHMATVVNDPDFQRRADALAASGKGDRVLGEIAAREQDTAKLTADDIDVILRMGISRKLLSDVMYAQRADKFRDTDAGKDAAAETYRCLTRAEMTRYNVVNTD